MIDIDIKEVYRYLGYHKKTQVIPTDEVDALIRSCIIEMEKVVEPRCMIKRFPIIREGHILNLGGLRVESKNLSKNLEDCTEVYLLAGTIGIEVDRLIRRAELTKMSQAMVYQAVGAAMIESYIDSINNVIRNEALGRGVYVRPRYSPGYGDFPLYHQKAFLDIVEGDKIGIHLTDTYLMIPSKSVTAVIGCSKVNRNCVLSGCEVCDQIDCSMRRS